MKEGYNLLLFSVTITILVVSIILIGTSLNNIREELRDCRSNSYLSLKHNESIYLQQTDTNDTKFILFYKKESKDSIITVKLLEFNKIDTLLDNTIEYYYED